MASSAVRVRWQSFQARIYLPGCISMHCGIFLHGRKGVRWGKAGYNYFDGRCLAPVLEVSPCLSTMSISRTAGQQPLEEGSIPFPAGAKQLFGGRVSLADGRAMPDQAPKGKPPPNSSS